MYSEFTRDVEKSDVKKSDASVEKVVFDGNVKNCVVIGFLPPIVFDELLHGESTEFV